MNSKIPVTRTLNIDSRAVTYCEFGDPQGIPVLAVHGSPGSRYQLLPLQESAEAAGVRIIAIDRPGVGGTTRANSTSFDSGLSDAIAVLDALSISEVTALGFSGGAGYSLTLARTHPERISRVVLACGMIPGAPNSTLTDRIPIVSLLYRISAMAPQLATAILDGKGPFARARAAKLDAWPAADRAIMADPRLRDSFSLDSQESGRQSSRAGVNDLRRYRRRYPLHKVRQHVTLLHGTADGNVPIEVARWALTRLPSATLHEIEDAGHYFAAAQPELVVSALAQPE